MMARLQIRNGSGKGSVKSRALAIGLLAIGLAMVCGFVILPASKAVWSHASALSSLEGRYEGYANETKNLDQLTARFDGLADEGGDREFFLVSSSDEQARALMERNLRKTGKSVGIRIDEIRHLPASTGVLGERSMLLVSLSGSMTSLDQFLEQTGTAFPSCFFEDIVLESADASADRVTAQMTVFAFWQAQ